MREKLKNLPEGFDLQQCPNPLLVGIPPAMCIDPSRSFWGQGGEELGLTSYEAKKQVGILGRRCLKGTVPVSLWSLIESMTNNNYGPMNSTTTDQEQIFINVRQLFAGLRGIQYVSSDIPQSDRCPNLTPLDISVYCH